MADLTDLAALTEELQEVHARWNAAVNAAIDSGDHSERAIAKAAGLTHGAIQQRKARSGPGRRRAPGAPVHKPSV